MTGYSLPDLPYAYDALEPNYSAEIVELHHDRHHATYVKGVNDALERLDEARDKGEFTTINQLEKNLAFNLSGHILHSILWKNMSPEGGGRPDGELGSAVERFFGSFDAFKDQMSQAAASVQGSGWATLAWEPVGQRLVVEQVYDHQGNIGNGTLPLLALDMWEHAYYLQYKNAKAKWAEAFWDIVNWQDVAGRFRRAQEVMLGV
ncbi:MAG: superoxide dismutase [Gammaproteobacteria bacterium]|nr:superoxide dismutase [Gammaproteobacteria bacterium]